MKRPELKRGTKPMKRAAIKPKRRRSVDTMSSLTLRAEYRAANDECEVTVFLRVALNASMTIEEYDTIGSWKRSLGLTFDSRPFQVDHLWGGTSGRLDLLSMLIVVDAAWHDWKTANFTAGLLLFLCVKHAKGEINAAEFRQCSGYSLAGWLALDKTIAACPRWLNPYRLRLIESLKEVTTERFK